MNPGDPVRFPILRTKNYQVDMVVNVSYVATDTYGKQVANHPDLFRILLQLKGESGGAGKVPGDGS